MTSLQPISRALSRITLAFGRGHSAPAAHATVLLVNRPALHDLHTSPNEVVRAEVPLQRVRARAMAARSCLPHLMELYARPAPDRRHPVSRESAVLNLLHAFSHTPWHDTDTMLDLCCSLIDDTVGTLEEGDTVTLVLDDGRQARVTVSNDRRPSRGQVVDLSEGRPAAL